MTNTSLIGIAGFFIGAGTTMFSTDFNRSLICFGIAVALIVAVAVLNKQGIPVSKGMKKSK